GGPRSWRAGAGGAVGEGHPSNGRSGQTVMAVKSADAGRGELRCRSMIPQEAATAVLQTLTHGPLVGCLFPFADKLSRNLRSFGRLRLGRCRSFDIDCVHPVLHRAFLATIRSRCGG